MRRTSSDRRGTWCDCCGRCCCRGVRAVAPVECVSYCIVGGALCCNAGDRCGHRCRYGWCCRGVEGTFRTCVCRTACGLHTVAWRASVAHEGLKSCVAVVCGTCRRVPACLCQAAVRHAGGECGCFAAHLTGAAAHPALCGFATLQPAGAVVGGAFGFVECVSVGSRRQGGKVCLHASQG